MCGGNSSNSRAAARLWAKLLFTIGTFPAACSGRVSGSGVVGILMAGGEPAGPYEQ